MNFRNLNILIILLFLSKKNTFLRRNQVNRKITQPLLFHSDRGIQYACKEFTNHLKANPFVKQSMSKKGNCWDNAVAESFFKTIKTELVYHYNYKTRIEAELQLFEYIETWYNRKIRHSTLNGKTILEFNQTTNNKHTAQTTLTFLFSF